MKKAELLNAKVESAEVVPETITKTVTKIMKTLIITRSPDGRTAIIQLQLQTGSLEVLIDEQTARAIAKVFD